MCHRASTISASSLHIHVSPWYLEENKKQRTIYWRVEGGREERDILNSVKSAPWREPILDSQSHCCPNAHHNCHFYPHSSKNTPFLLGCRSTSHSPLRYRLRHSSWSIYARESNRKKQPFLLLSHWQRCGRRSTARRKDADWCSRWLHGQLGTKANSYVRLCGQVGKHRGALWTQTMSQEKQTKSYHTTTVLKIREVTGFTLLHSSTYL